MNKMLAYNMQNEFFYQIQEIIKHFVLLKFYVLIFLRINNFH